MDGADGFDTIAGHGGENHALVLMGVAKGDLALQESVAVGLAGLGGLGETLELDHVLVEPLAIGTLGGELGLHLGIVHDAALLCVDQEHAAGLQAALLLDLVGGEFKHAGFGRHDDKSVLGDVEARGAQAVAVEDRTDVLTVGKRDRGRAIPRLHEAGVVLVEGLAGVVHRLVVGPRLGDHHHDRVREGATGEVEQLQRVIEHRGIGAVGIDDRVDLLDVFAEDLGGEIGRAGVHPVDVAAQGVDLAVVRDVAVRVRDPNLRRCWC